MNLFKNLTPAEIRLFTRLRSPAKIQDFLETLPINFEKNGETCRSPRLVLKYREAHCLEAAIFAAAVLRFHGRRPLIVDLNAAAHDDDHVIAVYQTRKYWGAMSHTNHAVLRYRESVYRDVRELVMSYFHEYTDLRGRKTLRSYSRPVDLSRFNAQNWISSEKPLWFIDKYLNRVRHYPILSSQALKNLRPADLLEIKAGKLTKWKS